MKKLLMLSAIVASVFGADYQIGAGFGRNVVKNSPIKNYNYGNIRIGKYLPENHILRVELERSIDTIVNNNKTSLNRALLNVEHYFNTDTKLTPYAFIGGGYQWVKGAYDNAAVADLGIGARYQITKVFDIFAEAKGMRDFHNNDNHFGILGGIEFNFGQKTAPEEVKAVQKIIDSDNDGVADYLDKCPNTPKGMKVDKNGCAVSFNFDITFDNNSAKIKPQFMEKVKKFADFLKAHPYVKAQIQGYTDNTGKFAYNMILSQKRAKAVYDALIKLGVDKNQLSWVGFGPENPVASNDTKEGRAQNRRVVAKLSY